MSPENVVFKTIIVMFLLTICGFYAIVRAEAKPGVEGDVYKQSKLMVSNNYHELMTIYEPVWLANLWPKLRNGVQLHLEDGCWKNLTVFFQDMLDGRAWALNAIDSTGRFSSGLLWGDNYWIGSQSECNDLNKRLSDLKFNTSNSVLSHLNYVNSLRKYDNFIDPQSSRTYLTNPEMLSKIILLDNTPPYKMAFSAVTLNLNITKTTLYSSHTILMGVCFPKACQAHDIHEIMDFSVKTYQNLKVSGVLPRLVKVNNVRQLNETYQVFQDPNFFLLCSIILAILVIIILGTIIDISEHSFKNSIESNGDQCPSTFKSFVKVDPVDSEYPEYSNINFDPNKEQLEANGSEQSSEEKPVHTIDGLIPNKYTEVVTGYNFHNKPGVGPTNKNDQINLVTVKKVINYEKSPKITLDIISIKKNKVNEEKIEIDSGKYCNTKYILSENPKDSIEIRNNANGLSIIELFHKTNRNSFAIKIVLSFSVMRNIHKIFSADIGEDTLPSIHGIKTIIILWAILANTCMFTVKFSDNKMNYEMNGNFLHHFVLQNNTYLIDTFFVVSGLLVSYLYCQMVKKQSARFNGILNKMVQILSIIAFRFFRLTPSYLFTIGVLEIVSKYFYSHNILEMMGNDYINCEKYWWRNSLYINTFYSLKESCMQWSWYISDDIQFHIVGILLVMITIKHVRTGILFFTMCLFIGWTTTATISMRTDHLPKFGDKLLIQTVFGDKHWSHIGPYLVGLCFGWILNKTNCCLLLSKKINFMLWSGSLSIFIFITCGLYESFFGNYGLTAYNVFSHTFWSLSIIWILVSCVTGYGGLINAILSSRLLYPLSRLSYGAYLLHPLLLEMFFISSGSIQHASPEILVIFFLGFSLITFFSSLILALLFEAPAISLLKLIYPSKCETEKEENSSN